MSSKTQKILAIIFMALPSLMLVMSGIMKLTGGEQVVTGLTKAGYGPYIKIFGIAELVFVALFWIPKTYKIGFYLILSYLGGAAAVEVAGGANPVAFALIALTWIGFYLKDKTNFIAE
ncbi:DoxX family protein [Emticicia sp. 17c]|uniref:DoxX family protein n=1 Tax=Emticicia sp. 17c TaxID=3127704 RepID=UPI00301D422C